MILPIFQQHGIGFWVYPQEKANLSLYHHSSSSPSFAPQVKKHLRGDLQNLETSWVEILKEVGPSCLESESLSTLKLLMEVLEEREGMCQW